MNSPSADQISLTATPEPESIAVPLDPDAIVATWRKDALEYIRPKERKDCAKFNFRGWYQCGRTDLKAAIDSWKWQQENMGKEFPSSIYLVSELWIFPEGFQVPQDWKSEELASAKEC